MFSLLMIVTFGLLFRMRGHHGFGDAPAMIWWGFFTMIMLNNFGHTPDVEWLLIDWVAVALLFTLGARPGWSKDCWPAWQSTDPFIVVEAMFSSLKRSFWFIPLLSYVSYRADTNFFVTLLASMGFYFGFMLCIRYCKDVADSLGLNKYGDNTWPFAEIMIGTALGATQIAMAV